MEIGPLIADPCGISWSQAVNGLSGAHTRCHSRRPERQRAVRGPYQMSFQEARMSSCSSSRGWLKRVGITALNCSRLDEGCRVGWSVEARR